MKNNVFCTGKNNPSVQRIFLDGQPPHFATVVLQLFDFITAFSN